MDYQLDQNVDTSWKGELERKANILRRCCPSLPIEVRVDDSKITTRLRLSWKSVIDSEMAVSVSDGTFVGLGIEMIMQIMGAMHEMLKNLQKDYPEALWVVPREPKDIARRRQVARRMLCTDLLPGYKTSYETEERVLGWVLGEEG